MKIGKYQREQTVMSTYCSLIFCITGLVLTLLMVIYCTVILGMIKCNYSLKFTKWYVFCMITGFGIEAVCIIGLGWVTSLRVALIVMCVGVAFSGLAISGELILYTTAIAKMYHLCI